MTTEQTDQPVIEQPPVLVEPPADSRLATFHALYAEAKAEADAANEKLKAITDAIKIELTQVAPEERRLELRTNGAPTLRLTYSEAWRVDSSRLKRDAPEVYKTFAKKSGSWKLKAVGGGR